MTTTLQWVLSEPSLLVSMSVVCILPGLTGWQPQVSSYLSDTVGASCILSEGLWEARVGRWTVSLIRGALGGGRGGKDRDSRYECARALLWWRIRCCLTISVSRTEPLVFMTVPSCTQARGIERECVCVCVLVCVCVCVRERVYVTESERKSLSVCVRIHSQDLKRRPGISGWVLQTWSWAPCAPPGWAS